MSAVTTSAPTALRPGLASVLDANLAAYQTLADDYRETSPQRLRHAARWLQDPEQGRPLKPVAAGHALDIGCADGSHAFLLAERGYNVTAVDFSSRMIELARSRDTQALQGPGPTFLEGEFLTGKFFDAAGEVAPPLDRKFELVVANAFIHLFPKPADEDVVRRALELVAPGGLALFSTTIEDIRDENFFAKTRMNGTAVERWRGHYPKDDFLSLVRDAAGDGFVITDLLTADLRGKPWLTVFARHRANDPD
ncbi:methyltransferase family protein [Promicromonospora sp. AC04]|uniref:class I SAM-dependent methyltransferase n=1 Tax=Promicromonospora sp. AC04 TaxID=2135723 RepID=UPI000D459D02|nr:class I SAM-dependent methyltransferase [Promicromonospora sp. AC04]PUB25551.1 methyltransferase family protein [Promicromonospora sp. AC04]